MQQRNLNFRSKLFDWELTGQYNIFSLNDKWWTPYVFAGIGIYHFNPYTKDSADNKTFLKPLSTEGQGFIPGATSYKLTDICIPCSKHDRRRAGNSDACADKFTLSNSRFCRRARPVARNEINYRDHLCRSRSLIVGKIIRRKSRRGSEKLIALNERAAVPARNEFLFVIRSGCHDYSAAGGKTHD